MREQPPSARRGKCPLPAFAYRPLDVPLEVDCVEKGRFGGFTAASCHMRNDIREPMQ